MRTASCATLDARGAMVIARVMVVVGCCCAAAAAADVFVVVVVVQYVCRRIHSRELLAVDVREYYAAPPFGFAYLSHIYINSPKNHPR